MDLCLGDFDFVVARPGPRLKSVVAARYDHGLQLAARVNEHCDITAAIGKSPRGRGTPADRHPDERVLPEPAHRSSRGPAVRFPLAAIELAARATLIRIRSHLFHVVSTRDLLNLKPIAIAARSAPGDAEDLAYLQRLLRNP